MRILFCSYAYPNAGQPQLATFNRTMLSGLAEKHEVRVIAPVPFLQKWRHAPDRGEYRALPNVTAEYPAFFYTPKLFRQEYHRFLWGSIRSCVRRTIAEYRPEVILSYWAHPDGTVAVRAAQEAGLPAVVIVGGSDVLLLGRSGRRRELILKTLQDADGVVTVSEDIAETLRADGVHPDRISIVPRGIDRHLFHPGSRAEARQELGLPPDREILLGVGRLVDVKDWPTWIEAMDELIHKGRKIACYVLGGGPLEDKFRRQVRALGLDDVIRLMGPQPQQDLARWYRAADLTVLSSRSEGVPNVLLETIASGGSFVATRVGGIPEIADVVFDRLVSPGNPKELGIAISDRLDHQPPEGLPRRFIPETHEQSAGRLGDALYRTVITHGLESTSRHNTDVRPESRRQAACETVDS